MARIERPPQPRSNQLNWADSRTSGLLFAIPLFEASNRNSLNTSNDRVSFTEYVRHDQWNGIATSGNTATQYTQNGFRCVQSSSARYAVRMPDSWLGQAFPGLWREFGDMTFIVRFEKAGNITNAQVWSTETYNNDGYGPGSRHNLLIRTDDSTPVRGVYWTINGTVAVNYVPSPAWAGGDILEIAITRKGSAITVWENGVQVATATNGTSFKAHRPMFFSQLQSGSLATPPSCILHYAYWWDRAMELDEVLSITGDPWGMFLDRKYERYSEVPVAVTGGVGRLVDNGLVNSGLVGGRLA